MATPDEDEDEDGIPGLPPNTPFYMTPEGHRAMRDELHALWSVERPKVVEVVSWAAGLGDRSENADYQYGKKRLREIDRRVRFLRKRLDRAEVVDPATQTRRDQVFFGATVTFVHEDDREVTVTIVGAEEADAGQGRISWLSPVARALLGKRVGDVVRLRKPGGAEEVEVLRIAYP
ncbi:transcription elongation factor GreB [Sabulicella glaciei]|uniref:Transcription elongation factor GreB n=1 Tax=Sabulicella glaciei TaxID=2984948 RepID=A0ABT3NWF1_9PROT|nr:transcription elongation factor GreB [Roseococcus sp. MDT2-1-1]MCW8086473.1 transcription elongation factor GreB [Roseococcus sp. MDT2-1-1]